LESRTKLRLFGGKGGVGKSTSAAATGVHLSNQGKKVLIVTSDPAPSLSDIFSQEIGGKIVNIKGSLYATEIDATKAVEFYKHRYGNVALDTINIVVPVEKEALDDIPEEVVPGLDELFAMEKIVDFAAEDEYDFIVWDTAPTGHTLRLLSLPTSVDRYVSAGIKLHARFSGLLNTVKTWFGKESSKDEIISSLTELKEIAAGVNKILSEKSKTEFTPVLIPEALALYQTERLRKTLEEQGISIKRMIINNIVPENHCAFCSSRRRMQQRYVDELHKRYGEYKIIEMPLFPEEIREIPLLLEYADILYKEEPER
jgi:arsenite-activated ATPase (arsA)